jgi:hypothetical protein
MIYLEISVELFVELPALINGEVVAIELIHHEVEGFDGTGETGGECTVEL